MEKLKFETRKHFFRRDELPSPLSEAAENVGRVMVDGYRMGTCFVASLDDRKFLVSALHCFLERQNKALTEGWAVFPSGDNFLVKPQWVLPPPSTAPDLDLLVSEVKRTGSIRPFRLSESHLPMIGQRVTLLGYPLSHLYSPEAENGAVASFGVIDDLTPSVTSGDDIWMYVKVENGSSGSPVLDENNKVLGVLVHTVEPGRGGVNQSANIRRKSQKMNYVSVATSLNILSTIKDFG